MIFEQLIHRDLGCASYLVGCQRAGEAVVVDPALDTRPLRDALARHDARLVGVVETHNHADHVSGHGTLALEHGMPIHIHPRAEPMYPSTAMPDGARIRTGSVELVALHTPGHRPEHCALAVVDHTRADEPWLVLSGDSLFVGDVARPDLAVGGEEGAAELYASLRDRLLTLADGVEVFPGHVAGSLCGRGMSAKASTTIGFERHFNPMLRNMPVVDFVREANANLAAKPPNLVRIVALNRGPLLAPPSLPPRLAAVPAQATVLDVRDGASYIAGHRPGALHAPAAQNGFATRAAFLLDVDGPPVIVAADEAAAHDAARKLHAAGFLELPGWVPAAAAGTAAHFTPIPFADVAASGLPVLDVREPDETPAPLPGALQIPFRLLATADLATLRPAAPLVIVCGTGVRAPIAGSMLARRGFGDLRPALDAGMTSLAATARVTETPPDQRSRSTS